MITRVGSVMIANAACPASYTNAEALNAGEVALFNENKEVITSKAEAVEATKVYVGVCEGKMDVVNPKTKAVEQKNQIIFSNEIQKGHASYVLQAYTAPVEEKIEFDFTSATIIVGHRYVLRIVYKDLYEHPGQFTHTYEVVAATTTAQDLCDAFAKQINKHPNRRVTVSSASNKLTITAMAKDDNEGVYSINEYSTVVMEAQVYTTIPGALLSNIPESVPGLTVTKTEGNPGKGYWKQVRDREMRNLGYRGHVFIDAYPVIEPKRYVKEGETYDYLVLENDNKYLSCDNQYVKSTPLTTEVYVKSGSLSSSNFAAFLKAFITGNAE